MEIVKYYQEDKKHFKEIINILRKKRDKGGAFDTCLSKNEDSISIKYIYDKVIPLSNILYIIWNEKIIRGKNTRYPEAVACIQTYDYFNYWTIHLLCVHQDSKSKGFGSKLLTEISNDAYLNKIFVLRLDSLPNKKQFYENGFRVTNIIKDFNNDKIKLYTMVKNLFSKK